MQIKVIYDTENTPSTAWLAGEVANLGYYSVGPITNELQEVVGNIFAHDTASSSAAFEELLNSLAPGLTYEII